MKRHVRPRITYANVTATLALIVALGGTSYAALTIGGENVRDGSLTGADLKDGSVGPADLATSQRASAAKKKKAKPGPPGPQGAAGTQGAQGAQGAQGPAGTAPACAGNGSGDTMVSAGAVCIDRYEVSVWSTPTGGTQFGVGSDDYTTGAGCNDNGEDCENIFARSVPGVAPSRLITYFQAQQALANVGKRLPSNAEWQQAVAGTPDPGTDNGTSDCNISTAVSVANTGSRDDCVSRFGANDMVGNLAEWVGDWDEEAVGCANWPAGFGTDSTCVGMAEGDTPSRFPGALIRGGNFIDSTGAGPFAVLGSNRPSNSGAGTGFRGAR